MIPSAEQVPPCIREIHRKLAAGEHVGHPSRYAFGTFMLKAGAAEGDIVRQFSRQQNFVSEKTIGIVRNLAEVGYVPPNCSRMKTDGLCVAPEPLCSHIANPISFYRARRGVVEDNRVVTSTPAPAPSLALYIGKCQCGAETRPLPRPVAESVLGSHYWQMPAAEEDRHIEVQYIAVGDL